MENTGIHPDGYPLPCCFSLAKNKTPPKEIKKEEKAKGPKEKEKLSKRIKTLSCKINTKTFGPLPPYQCSHLPLPLQKMLVQDQIFKYDPILSISNGFIRKGVVQNQSKYIFNESSFINSFIEITDYKGTSSDFIKEIIAKLENNIKIFQYCNTLQKHFRKVSVNKEDIIYVQKILNKKETKIIFEPRITQNIHKDLSEIKDYQKIIFNSTKKNYIYQLILSLKNYIDFLNSNEEKKDDYIIPVLNAINDDPINIIIFEKIKETIHIKKTEYNHSKKCCFILKDSHYYEPIIYRVNMMEIHDIKVFSKEIFSSFTKFSKEKFTQYLKTPYPRGRKEDIKSGINANKLHKFNCSDSSNYCKEWLTHEEYLHSFGSITNGLEIKWIKGMNQDIDCINNGTKMYGKIKKISHDSIITSKNEKINLKEILIKSKNPTINPILVQGITKKDDWIWIGKGCTDIHDRDIESLLRKKYNKKGDKLLLKYSNTKINKDSKSNENLLLAIHSHFFIINNIIEDIDQMIDKELKKQKINDYNLPKGYKIKDHFINNYSEVCFLIAKKKEDKDIIIPIQPTILFVNNKYNFKYDLTTIPDYKHAVNYLKLLDIQIKSVIVKEEVNEEDQFVSCIILRNGTYLPVIQKKLNTIELNNYQIIYSDCNPYEIDTQIYNIGSGQNSMTDYINDFNKRNEYKKITFNHILNLINDKSLLIEGNIKDINQRIHQNIYFKKDNDIIIEITKNEYYLMDHKLNHKKLNEISYNEKEIPYYGEIIELTSSTIIIQCSIVDVINHIIKDSISINQYKVNRIMNLIYNQNKENNSELYINHNNIFKSIDNKAFDKKTNNTIIEYSNEGKIILNPSIEEKMICQKVVYMKQSDININYDKKLLKDFIHNMIINVDNGYQIKSMNQFVDDIIRISDLEKNTPPTECFYKYSKDKDIMYETLQSIFVKSSEYITTLDINKQNTKKRVYTNKLKTSPFYINELFGYNSINLFSIDNKGYDWYSIIDALKELKISLKFIKEAPGIRFMPDIQKLILHGINKIVDEQEILDTIKEYNHYNKIRYKDFQPFTKKQDIIDYWMKNKNKRINITDIKIILKELEDYYHFDLAFMVISFNDKNKNDMHFYHTKELYKDTPVILLHHITYGNDYILSNISKNKRLSLKIEELYQISDKHKLWINQDLIKIRPCEKQKILIEDAEERIKERELLIQDDKELIQNIKNTYCKD